MKYLNITAFKRHFDNPLFDKIKLYLIVIQDLYERESMISYILKQINIKSFNLSKFSNQSKLSSVISTFQSPSLLGGEPLVIIEDIDIFSKQDIQNLISYVKANDVHLIMGAQSRQVANPLYSIIEKKGLVFDLTAEKIWEKEKRFTNFIVEKAIIAKKISQRLLLKLFLKK